MHSLPMQPLNLKVDSVALSFGDRYILRDVYLDCKQGEIVGLLGRNGCGKSCLLKIIFGTLTPQYKYVSINDQYIRRGFIDTRIAYLPQHNYLPRGMRVDQLARTLVAEKHWDEFAASPAYIMHGQKQTDKLSGGELRQLEMLMILYSNADFILLDEPFTHVSPVQSDVFKQQLRKAAKTKGIIVTDHQYYNIVDVSDRIILIDNGYTRHLSDPEELVRYGYLSRM
ncbi:ATP-binding cassette domain-containing protein [Mucilaginibacter mali]|uniref:ATP-binding cassette domain-containing protein n=1 Tax=Mucilaginibacter mali TaxID=2740462 RepID=A0A7D4QBY4_9SPHI|nr:ATP-binding cassette domain-containing protein [Mucilaginibacter mali]QKJ30844.1 ATP-binding cassette domain-containing protein [Mucilaginibacter mali]